MKRNKLKIWLISRLDQSVIIAEHLNKQGKLVQWDRFISFSENNLLGKYFFKGTRRILSNGLSKIKSSHFLPELCGKFLKFLRYREYSKIQDILFAKLTSLRPPVNFDIVHGQGNYSLETALLCKKKLKKIFISDVTGQMGITRMKQLKKVYSDFNLPLKVGISILQQRRLKEAKNSDAIICPSEIVSVELKNLGINKKKIYVVPFESPLAKDLIKKKKIFKEKKIIALLFFGEVSVDKGVHHILSIQNKLTKNNFETRLHIVGEIKHLFLKKNTNKQNVKFYGKLHRMDLIKLYSNTDIFIFPSYTEGSALVTYEALAAGLPLITTAAAGSINIHGLTGYTLKNCNETKMYSAVEKLISSIKLRKKFSNNAKKLTQNLLKKSYGERIENVYQKILKNVS